MMSEPVYVTADGLEKMKGELADRINIKRPEIAEKLSAAIKMGDLKENADYHVAKEEQAFNEGRIQQLQDNVMRAEVIKETVSTNRVRLGNTVVIAEEGYEDEPEEYRIVGAQEADPADGLISNESPIGRALIGAKLNEVVSAKTPGGIMKMKVLEIK